MAEPLDCGCVPLAGGGAAKLCPVGRDLFLRYEQAIEADPINLPAWQEAWGVYCAHLGQIAWASDKQEVRA